MVTDNTISMYAIDSKLQKATQLYVCVFREIFTELVNGEKIGNCNKIEEI